MVAQLECHTSVLMVNVLLTQILIARITLAQALSHSDVSMDHALIILRPARREDSVALTHLLFVQIVSVLVASQSAEPWKSVQSLSHSSVLMVHALSYHPQLMEIMVASQLLSVPHTSHSSALTVNALVTPLSVTFRLSAQRRSQLDVVIRAVLLQLRAALRELFAQFLTQSCARMVPTV
jgi:hypothetical protein